MIFSMKIVLDIMRLKCASDIQSENRPIPSKINGYKDIIRPINCCTTVVASTLIFATNNDDCTSIIIE